MSDPENLLPICPHGCNADGDCCGCCIYVPNIDEMDLRTMTLEERQARLYSDPAYAEQKRQEYNARYGFKT